MRIWLSSSLALLVLVVLCCQPAEDDGMAVALNDAPAPDQSTEGTASDTIPALIGAPPAEESSGTKRGEFEIVATTFSPSDDVPEDIPEYAVTYDPNIGLLLRVEEVVHGDSPFDRGQKVILLVHSPAMMFAGYDFSGRQFAYKFAVLEWQDGTTSYSLIGLDTWPRSRARTDR